MHQHRIPQVLARLATNIPYILGCRPEVGLRCSTCANFSSALSFSAFGSDHALCRLRQWSLQTNGSLGCVRCSSLLESLSRLLMREPYVVQLLLGNPAHISYVLNEDASPAQGDTLKPLRVTHGVLQPSLQCHRREVVGLDQCRARGHRE